MDFMDQLVDEVMAYESDTFSASRSGITKEEAGQVVEQAVRALWDTWIDGASIDEKLSELRETDDL